MWYHTMCIECYVIYSNIIIIRSREGTTQKHNKIRCDDQFQIQPVSSSRASHCVRMRASISGRGKEKWVDQSGASCHVIMRNFHVSMYKICIYIM